MLQVGADVNFGMPEPPLIQAANAGLTDIVECLLNAAADADANQADPVSFIQPQFSYCFIQQACLFFYMNLFDSCFTQMCLYSSLPLQDTISMSHSQCSGQCITHLHLKRYVLCVCFCFYLEQLLFIKLD